MWVKKSKEPLHYIICNNYTYMYYSTIKTGKRDADSLHNPTCNGHTHACCTLIWGLARTAQILFTFVLVITMYTCTFCDKPLEHIPGQNKVFKGFVYKRLILHEKQSFILWEILSCLLSFGCSNDAGMLSLDTHAHTHTHTHTHFFRHLSVCEDTQ